MWDAAASNLTQYGGDINCPFCESRSQFCGCKAVASHARLVAEWHPDNPPAESVAAGSSNQAYLWRCSTCEHVWEAKANDRSTRGNGCPACARRGNRRGKHGGLGEVRPDLAAEWDEGRNGGPCEGITCGSNKKAWWSCGECGWSWEALVKARALQGTGCPECQQLNRGKPRKIM